MKNYYEILGVNPNSSDEEIKTIYKKLAKKYHPDNFATASEDKKKQAEEKMKEINAAYDSIKEERSRPKSPPLDDFSFPPDIIDITLGRNRQKQPANNPTRGADLRYDLTIELEEAAFGKETSIKIPRQETCSHCKGNGGTEFETCPDCHGTGQRSIIMNTLIGQFQTVKTCQRCHGKGKIIKTPCKHCHGNGKINVSREISLHIPKGIDNGNRIRVRGGGNAGDNGGEAGDLYVYISVKPHKIFQRKGSDIYCEVPISFVQAALGATIEVPTIDGKFELDIPAGTQSDTIKKINGKGITYLRSDGRGDEYVTIKVVTPKNLNNRQKKLLEQFDKAVDDKSQPEKKTFFNMIKNFAINFYSKLITPAI